MANRNAKVPTLFLIVAVLVAVTAYLFYQESQEDISVDLPEVEIESP